MFFCFFRFQFFMCFRVNLEVSRNVNLSPAYGHFYASIFFAIIEQISI